MADEFNEDFIASVGEEIRKEAIENLDKIAGTAMGILVIETPVDRGQARASWNFTLNRVDESVPDRPSKGEKLPPPSTKPDKQAQSLDDVYFITNSAQHILFLNEGHSAKREAYFIDRAIDAAIKAVE